MTAPRLAVGFTHAAFEPRRRVSLSRARETLDMSMKLLGVDWTVLVICDEIRQGNLVPWLNTLDRLLESDATHLVMLPDDVILPTTFAESLLAFVQAFPEDLLDLFANHPDAGQALRQLYTAYETPDGFVGFGVFPRALAARFALWRAHALVQPWRDAHAHPQGCNADESVALWAMSEGIRTIKPLPSLVDHDASLPSLELGGTFPLRRSSAWAPELLHTKPEAWGKFVCDLGLTFPRQIQGLVAKLRQPALKRYLELRRLQGEKQ